MPLKVVSEHSYTAAAVLPNACTPLATVSVISGTTAAAAAVFLFADDPGLLLCDWAGPPW